MCKTIKIWIIISAVLIALGILTICAGLFIFKYDFKELDTVKYVKKTYEIGDEFTEISADIKDSAFELILSDDGSQRIECYESDRVKYEVSVENGVLEVKERDSRKWYDYIGVSFGSCKTKIFLTGTEYGKLKIGNKAGAVSVPCGLIFDSIEIDMSAGSVTCGASSKGAIEISNSAGGIKLSSLEAKNIKISSKTGSLNVEKINVEGKMEINGSTGSANIADVTCQELEADYKTGSITLKNVTAKGDFNLSESTGSIIFDKCDAENIKAKTRTGSVRGTFLTDKIFRAESSTGNIDVPMCISGGTCEVTTSTGSIDLKIAE